MNRSPKLLTPTARKLLDEFDEAAQAWSWERDQGGGGPNTEKARLAYEAAKLKLALYIASRLRSKRK